MNLNIVFKIKADLQEKMIAFYQFVVQSYQATSRKFC